MSLGTQQDSRFSLLRFQSTRGIVVAERALNRITGCRFATAESGIKSADLCVFGGPFLGPFWALLDPFVPVFEVVTAS